MGNISVSHFLITLLPFCFSSTLWFPALSLKEPTFTVTPKLLQNHHGLLSNTSLSLRETQSTCNTEPAGHSKALPEQPRRLSESPTLELSIQRVFRTPGSFAEM